jgi:hypothetical protein
MSVLPGPCPLFYSMFHYVKHFSRCFFDTPHASRTLARQPLRIPYTQLHNKHVTFVDTFPGLRRLHG